MSLSLTISFPVCRHKAESLPRETCRQAVQSLRELQRQICLQQLQSESRHQPLAVSSRYILSVRLRGSINSALRSFHIQFKINMGALSVLNNPVCMKNASEQEEEGKKQLCVTSLDLWGKNRSSDCRRSFF